MNRVLEENNLMIKKGTILDAAIVTAPSSAKDKGGKRDEEMSSAKLILKSVIEKQIKNFQNISGILAGGRSEIDNHNDCISLGKQITNGP